jgi:ribonuclease J
MSDRQTNSTVRIIPLGGLGEIGSNMMVLEIDDDLFIIDAGLMFPEEYMLGIDFVIPDFTWLREKKGKIRAIILTHGHEDHTGALPFLLKEFNAPVYGTPFTLALVERKLEEYDLMSSVTLNKIAPRDILEIGKATFEFIRVNHSIVDGVGIAIQTPLGIILHTGDFKIDQTPLGDKMIDLNRFAEYGEKGVFLMMSDSTNADFPGFSLSELTVKERLEKILDDAPGRVVIAVFASNIRRMQGILESSHKLGRKVALIGRSIIENIEAARRLKILDVPEDLLVDFRDIGSFDDSKITMITTGSQGEPYSALSLMATNAHKHIKIHHGDMVIFSSRFIPGNERAITRIINQLYRKGAEVVYEQVKNVHTSGHAYQDELKMMLNLVKPAYFMPVHGEYRLLAKHLNLAQSVGIPENRLILAEDGDIITLSPSGVRKDGRVPVGKVFIDGKGVGDVGRMVLRDRKHLSEDGLVVILIVLDGKTGDLAGEPNLISRGFIFEDFHQDMLDEAKDLVKNTILGATDDCRKDSDELQGEISKVLKRFFNARIKRRPMILPIVLEM